MLGTTNLHELAKILKEERSRCGYDPTKSIGEKYTPGDYDYVYDGECFYDDDDDDEVEWSSLSTSARDIVKRAKILEDEKKKSGMTGTSLDTQSNFHHPSCDEEKSTNMDIEDGASEENIFTERKNTEKRKSQEDRVESEQNNGIEIAIEFKKRKDISKNDV